jgi:hypothetical protein
MNLDALEILVRRTLKGENVAPRINSMRQKGALTAIEYKCLKSQSWQVVTADTHTLALRRAYLLSERTQ